MSMPRDVDARKYYRTAIQRLREAELIFGKLGLSSAAVYLAGYSVECILKALLLHMATETDRGTLLGSLRHDLGHNLRRLRAGVLYRGATLPPVVARDLLLVSSWSPDLRYEPGPGDAVEAERFLRAARSIVYWADGRI